MAMVQLLVDGGIGLILIISGIIMNMISKRNNKQCTKSVEGYVISYSFTGGITHASNSRICSRWYNL